MRPPMTSSKNDGVSPPHRKTQLHQKEVLVENHKPRVPHPHYLNSAQTEDSSRIRVAVRNSDSISSSAEVNSNDHFNDNFFSNDESQDSVKFNASFHVFQQTNSNSNCLRSDVSDCSNINNLNSSKISKSSSSASTREVPKNLIVNAFEQCHTKVAPDNAVFLPLSETEVLLQNIETTVGDPTKSICLNKNSASLIFTKKDLPTSTSSSDCSSSIGDSESANIVNRRPIYTNSQENSDAQKQVANSSRNKDTVLLHRRSLQLNYSSLSKDPSIGNRPNATASNRKQHAYSWYAPVYSALEEELEQESRESSPIHNLANIKHSTKTENEAAALLEKNNLKVQPQLHQSRIRRPQVCSLPTGGAVNGITVTANQNENEGPQAPSLLGGPLPKCKRLGNFLKSLVSRKSSRETVNVASNPPQLPSPEITISHSPSDQDLLRDTSIFGEKVSSSTASLNVVQQKIRSVVPRLKREGSASSLRQEKSNSVVQYTGLRKCETVVALAQQSSMVEQIKPQNRLRNSLSVINNATCSRCSSLLSLAASGSRYSLNPATSNFLATFCTSNNNLFGRSSSNINETSATSFRDVTANRNEVLTCKLCLSDVSENEVTRIGQCGCRFCTECMRTYVDVEISEGAYEISCPDGECPEQGIVTLAEIAALCSPETMEKHHRYRLNREIEIDKTRTWCPRAGCETICLVGATPTASSSSNENKANSITHVLCVVQCPTCKDEFCSGCKKPWHGSATCEENNKRLAEEGQEDSIAILLDNDLIKRCPMCAVPIEKDEGCAQMMCKRCKHVFCWYCLASLDDDFLLRHYDKGPCKNKLGHSRASVVWHRAQVIGIFAGFGILLLVASPLLLLAAPCIICCKCRICNGSAKLDDGEPDFDEAMALQSDDSNPY